MANAVTLLLLLVAGCGGAMAGTPSPFVPPFTTDTASAESIAPGVVRRYLHSPVGPWAIQVLDVDLSRCYSAVAVKGNPGAVGRARTSTLLRELARTREVIGGVNADFFLFAPPGVPTGALIQQGRVVTGPSTQPVLGFDAAGVPHLEALRSSGSATLAGRRWEIQGWNRAVPAGLALFDGNWGRALDTASSAIEVVVRGWDPGVVEEVDTAVAGAVIPEGAVVLAARRGAPETLRSALLALRRGDTVRVRIALSPSHPWEAVGGRPLLLRDSIIQGEVDTEGQPGFATGRHPRTAVGIANGRRRLLLVTVDGRQLPYSDGMTLRELANLLLALGVPEAINLDGGGSTTLVYREGDSLRVANRPSDATGERPVGDALAIVKGCAQSKRPGASWK